MRVFIETMGCRTNSADSSQLATYLRQHGVMLTAQPDEADWILINSCTVTHKADRDTGKTLRRYKALPSAPKVMVLGCLPSATPEHPVLLLADRVVPGWDVKAVKDAILEDSSHPFDNGQPHLFPKDSGTGPMAIQSPADLFQLEKAHGLSRVNIKICQGCDGHCTYCIVPTARGKPVSYPPERILHDVAMAWQAGYREVILSGTHLLKYGKDLSPSLDLLLLMKELLNVAPQMRFRFGSVEPDPLLEPLLDQMAASRQWCRHLHVALQHGSDTILASMGRTYRFEAVSTLLKQAVVKVPGITLGLDFIVGFPGETDELFDEACQHLEDLPFTYMHVFAFSPRPGTPAANWLDRAPNPQVVKARSAKLRALSRNRRKEGLVACLNTPVQVLLEQSCPGKPGYLLGHSDHYFDVALPAPESRVGSVITCLPVQIEGEWLIAEPIVP